MHLSKNDAVPLSLKWGKEEVFELSVRVTPGFEWRNALGPARRIGDRCRRFVLFHSLAAAVAAAFVGCSSPAVRQQRLVARPNMTFADSAVLTYNSPRLLPQIAPAFGGDAAQNSGCTSCR